MTVRQRYSRHHISHLGAANGASRALRGSRRPPQALRLCPEPGLLAAAALAVALLTGCGEGAPEAVAGARPTSASTLGAANDEVAQRPVVLFLGDSLSAGYGLAAEQAFPALVQQRIDDAGLPHRVVNAGVSGDTTAGGLRRLDWLLQQPVDTLVIQLGGNDMLRGQSVEALRSNFVAIAERARERRPGLAIVLAGMRAAPNLGPRYAKDYDAAFAAVAEEIDAVLIPFLLDGVAAERSLNQADGIHPTAAGHRRVAENVWATLGPLLLGRSAGRSQTE